VLLDAPPQLMDFAEKFLYYWPPMRMMREDDAMTREPIFLTIIRRKCGSCLAHSGAEDNLKIG
jgi:hypothetical protein